METFVVVAVVGMVGFLAGMLALGLFVTSSRADEEAERW